MESSDSRFHDEIRPLPTIENGHGVDSGPIELTAVKHAAGDNSPPDPHTIDEVMAALDNQEPPPKIRGKLGIFAVMTSLCVGIPGSLLPTQIYFFSISILELC